MRIFATIGMMLATIVGAMIIVAITHSMATAFGWFFLAPMMIVALISMFFMYYKATE